MPKALFAFLSLVLIFAAGFHSAWGGQTPSRTSLHWSLTMVTSEEENAFAAAYTKAMRNASFARDEKELQAAWEAFHAMFDDELATEATLKQQVWLLQRKQHEWKRKVETGLGERIEIDVQPLELKYGSPEWLKAMHEATTERIRYFRRAVELAGPDQPDARLFYLLAPLFGSKIVVTNETMRETNNRMYCLDIMGADWERIMAEGGSCGPDSMVEFYKADEPKPGYEMIQTGSGGMLRFGEELTMLPTDSGRSVALLDSYYGSASLADTYNGESFALLWAGGGRVGIVPWEVPVWEDFYTPEELPVLTDNCALHPVLWLGENYQAELKLQRSPKDVCDDIPVLAPACRFIYNWDKGRDRYVLLEKPCSEEPEEW